MADGFEVVTGAFGYSGRYITQRLLARGIVVKTLTGHPDRTDPFGGRVQAVPLDFDNPDALARSLEGATVLYNTYWIRFARGAQTHARAVEDTRTLFHSACRAGVRRVVHVSIAKPSLDSHLPYYRGKALVERDLRESGLSHAVLRPTVLFGATAGEDVLLNNIAWLLRRFPAVAVPGAGGYRIQPIHVEDLADLAVSEGHGSNDGVIDAVGPETFTFDELVRLIAAAVGSRARLVHVPPTVAVGLARVIGWFVGDVILTRDEVDGLMADLLWVDSPAAGTKRLSDWLSQHASPIGMTYASELDRHFR